MINVILADHQRVYRTGMASVLAAEDDIRIVGQPHCTNQLLNSLENVRAHVLLLSAAFFDELAEIKEIAARQQTAILLLEEPGKVTPPQFSPEVKGVMQRSADEATVVRCVRHLARGGRVLRFVRNQPLESHRESVGVRVSQRLSQLESRVITLLMQGFKNREIAMYLGSTEQGVKNSLRRIFDKTGVYGRLELALYVLHHGIVVLDQADARPTLALSSLAAIRPSQEQGHSRIVN